MNLTLSVKRLNYNRLACFSKTYAQNGLIDIATDKLLLTRDQFNDLANDALMNSELNNFFAEGVKIMRHNNIPYTDLNLVNLYLQKNNIAQVEIVN